MKDRDATFVLHGSGRQVPLEATADPLRSVIPHHLDVEISQIHGTTELESGTGPILNANGGSEEIRWSIPEPLVSPPDLPPSHENFITLAKWRGRILEANGSTFRALLFPVVGEESQTMAEIHVENIDREDRHLIRNGAAFYWSVGYLDRPSGRIQASYIRFTRVPPWSSRDLAEAESRARELLNEFRSAK